MVHRNRTGDGNVHEVRLTAAASRRVHFAKCEMHVGLNRVFAAENELSLSTFVLAYRQDP